MRTYAEHIPCFERELSTLGHAFGLDFQQFLLALENRYTEAADEACRLFAKEYRWPPMSDQTRLEVCLRLSCASMYCQELGDKSIDLEESGQFFLESLLIEFWRDVGREDWFDKCLIHWSHPAEFYPPVDPPICESV